MAAFGLLLEKWILIVEETMGTSSGNLGMDD